jgi:hypothetical protein
LGIGLTQVILLCNMNERCYTCCGLLYEHTLTPIFSCSCGKDCTKIYKTGYVVLSPKACKIYNIKEISRRGEKYSETIMIILEVLQETRLNGRHL